MSAQSWLRSLKTRRFSPKAGAGHPSARRSGFRPRLEVLEERTLLTFGFGSAFSIGGPSFDYANSIAKDATGNTYLSGEFSGQGVNFNPNGQPVYLNGGQFEGYVAMFHADQTLAWATDIGPAEGAQIAVQGSNVYVASASYSGSIGSTFNILALKLNAGDGSIQWTTTLASGGSESYRDVAVGPSGNVYVTSSNASSQAFVAKLDPLGNILWTRTTTGGTGDGTGVAVDSSENVFATGGFTGSVSFGPGHTLTSQSGTQDVFAWKLNSSGSTVWAGSMGSIGDDIGYAIAVDNGGNAILTGGWGSSQTASTGKVSASNDFDPGTGVLKLTSNGGYDVFIVKLAPNANGSMKLSWARDIGGSNSTTGTFDWAKGVAVDGAGNVYTTGSFSDSVDFDPSSGKYVLKGSGARDIFVSKLDASGNFVAAAAMGGTVYDDGAGIAVDGAGNVWSTGGFRGIDDFDPTSGTYYLTQNGYPANQIYDAFVLELTQSGAAPHAAVGSASAKPQALSLALVQSSLTNSLPTHTLASPSADQNTGTAANTAVLAGESSGLLTVKAAQDQLFANLARSGVKQDNASLGAIERADELEFTPKLGLEV
jgi:hypothetical protein